VAAITYKKTRSMLGNIKGKEVILLNCPYPM
jgi:hypothetical protein